MINQVLLYIAAAFLLLWGIAHLFPTRAVVAGFGELSADNRNIITMEWIIEGVALIFIGVITGTIALIDAASMVSKAVYGVTFVALNVLSVVSLLTGFKVRLVPFKLCPVIFTRASLLILLGMYL